MLQSQTTADRLTPSTTRALLDKLDHFPIRKWGQNFLVDPNIVEKSLALACIQKNDTVVEIGPGLGCLSTALIRAGADVFAVEIDKKLAHHLRENFASEPRFHLLEGDAVAHPAAGKPADITDWKIVANLPYAISTPWLEHVLQMKHLPASLTLMLQREAAQRLTASPGCKHYSAITLFLSALYKKGGEHHVARQCFYPAPGVDSQLLHLVRIPGTQAISATARDVIRTLFTQRRKQIASLAKQFLQPTVSATWLNALTELGFSPTARPETLPLPCWQTLDHILTSSSSANS